jgi:PAS domain S-box-containing protein
MPNTWMVSLLFFTAGTVVLASGVFTLQGNRKASANRVFFALTAAITIWSYGMALATAAADAAACERFRRISAVGWGTAYAFLLHFILVITDKSSLLKKWWFLSCLYLPALYTVFAFAVPNGLHPVPYDIRQNEFGWINVAQNNLWDFIFYAYYIGYTMTGLLLLYRWDKKSPDTITKKKARIIGISVLSALVLGTMTDVALSSLISTLPQMAPIIMLVPVLAIYHVLQKDSFGIAHGVDKKTSYIILFTSVLLYIVLAALQILFSGNHMVIGPGAVDKPVIRGIIVQIQMLLSLYLVLKENRPGYISAAILNLISLLSALIYMARYMSAESLPGIVSYAGVLVIVTLIKNYKEKNNAYIRELSRKRVKEEFYSSIFQKAPVGIAIMNDNSHATDEEFEGININPMYEQILGRSKEELQNITWQEMTHPDDLDTDIAYYEKFLRGELEQYALEKRFIRPDGSIVWVHMLIAPFHTSDGSPGHHLCIITDITKRKEIEATLKYHSEHVPLTGLFNRDVLVKQLARDASKSAEKKRALVCINLSAVHTLSLRYGFRYSQTMLKKSRAP